MRGVDKEDAGDITCELSNSKGKEAATAKLRVQSKCPSRYGQLERMCLYYSHYDTIEEINVDSKAEYTA